MNQQTKNIDKKHNKIVQQLKKTKYKFEVYRNAIKKGFCGAA